MDQNRYTSSQKALHWLSVVLICFMAYSGLAYLYEWSDDAIIVWHQIAGQVFIVALFVRIIVRLRKGGRHASTHATWERRLSGMVHMALYVAMIAFFVTGYVSASALRDSALLLPLDIAFARSDIGEMFLEAHYALKWVLAGLLSLHLAGALKHLVIDRDDTFQSILPSKREDTP